MDKGIEDIIKMAVNITMEKHNVILIRSLKMMLESLEMGMIDMAKTHITEVITILEMGEEE